MNQQHKYDITQDFLAAMNLQGPAPDACVLVI